MNYRDCLILATILFWPNNRFDCEAFAKLLFIYTLYRISTDKYYTPQQMTKRTSNDLDRLYRMGFLLRKRVKRIAITRSGQVLNRGFKYEYSISRQGRQYFIYLMKKTFHVEKGTLEDRNNKLVLTGDPLWEPLYRKIVADYSKISPRAQDLIYEYVELTGRKGGRYNRFQSSMDKKVLLTLIVCARELPDRFEYVQTEVEKFMAAKKRSKEADIYRSRIIEACQSSNEGAKAMTKILLALTDRVRRFMQSGQYNRQQLPVSPKHPYVILEVDEMLQRMAWQISKDRRW